ncbi:MAG: ABC-type nitrate/sulfonate/bicarbonate transport system, ATPase component [Clostridia bacterium]|nr:ABC-type nitrate/sulfonate/bicarbonate transport system, ATPase component [Clostridia bacterium]
MIELLNVTKSFSKGKEKFKVLEDISFSVNKGEILCLLGASGCGKSTLLRLMGGFDLPDSGSIAMNGSKVSKPTPDSILVFQEFNQLLPWKTVLQNVIYPLKVNHKYQSDQKRREHAEKYLEMVKLEGFYHSFPHQLSGGMKQKAALARALALQPSILLMDEPFGSLDALTRQSLQTVLLESWDKTGVSIIFVTHDIQEAMEIADNTLQRPRSIGSSEYMKLYEKLYTILCEK